MQVSISANLIMIMHVLVHRRNPESKCVTKIVMILVHKVKRLLSHRASILIQSSVQNCLSLSEYLKSCLNNMAWNLCQMFCYCSQLLLHNPRSSSGTSVHSRIGDFYVGTKPRSNTNNFKDFVLFAAFLSPRNMAINLPLSCVLILALVQPILGASNSK